jgi:adenine-specific DNA-methyltransferase
MPTLNWIGKEAVVKHHKDVPFRLLEPVPELSCGSAESGNLIVQGDNLHALKALLPRYAGQVKCIYIDPPYNTGNEGWVYNDNVNSAEIRRWLGEVVGKEGETLDRHDRWLCMMYPRLVLLRQFLREDGAIFVSIGNDEVATLRLLMDEVFGSNNFITIMSWKSRAKPSNTGEAKLKPQNDAEFVVCYRKKLSPKFKLVKSGRERSYPHSDTDGNYRLQTILKSNRGESKRDTMRFELNGYTPPPTKRWQAGEDEIRSLFARNRITFQTGEPMLKYYEHEENDEFSPFWCHVAKELSSTAENGKKTLNAVLGIEHGFDTVKPIEVIQYLLNRILLDGDVVLDSFAGSGTTAHAVLKQNAADGGNRRFILVEMDENIATNVTAERVKRVAQGYTDAKSEQIEGLGGGFQFCKLSKKPLFTAEGQIRDNVKFSELAEFVWFSEMGAGHARNMQRKVTKSPLLGIANGKAVFLLYNGILADRSDTGGNVLNGRTLEILRQTAGDFDGPWAVYGTRTRLDPTRLNQLGIEFKLLPYKLREMSWA